MIARRSIRCAIVGLGGIGREHAAALASVPDADLVLCVDPDPAAARHCPAGVRFTSDVAALADVRPDAVVIATPEPAHREAAEAAVAVGAAVLCEKPLASNLEDADAIINAAERAGSFLAVAHTLRFDARYRAVRERVANGALGCVLSLATRRAMTVPEGRIYAGRTTLALCLGVHDVDVIRWLGGEVTRVYAEAGPSVLDPRTADSFVATLRLASGAVACLELGWALPERTGVVWDTSLVVVGTEASAYLELRGGDLGGLAPELTYMADVAGVAAGVVRVQDAHFVRAVADRSVTWPGGAPADARRAVELALALDRSATTATALDV